jgi:two-component system cell cycle response regulator DivK
MQGALFKRNAVFIERDELQQVLFCDILGANGFDVYPAKSAVDGLVKIKENSCELALINAELAEESFIMKLVNKIRSEKTPRSIPIVGISLYERERKKNLAEMFDAFLTKPFSVDKFVRCVVNCIECKNGSENSYSQ